jgi:Tol biopolymer transport system component
MGEVYRARDTRLGRVVALKVLPESLSSDAGRLRRFEMEAHSASLLNHPNIVTVHDVGTSGATSYIAMELVEGATLRRLLGGGVLPLKRLLAIAAQVAEGLARAHAAGIVHRDLKPENVMVTEDGLAKILDFGLAKLTGPEPASGEGTQAQTISRQTEPGVILGTVAYMSPEQASGLPVDFHSDQFSFGSVLYEMLTGKAAFSGKTRPETLAAIIREEPEPIEALAPKTPAPFRWIVDRCLAKESRERYDSTGDLARELADLRNRLSEITRGEVVAPTFAGTLRYGGIPRALLIAAALLVGLVIAALFRRTEPTPSGRFTVERLTQHPGVEAEPTIAPDAKSVVYARNRHLWLLRVGGSNAIDLTPGTTVNNFAPAFSPDGSSIAFNSGEDGGIFVMGATGENVRRVTSRGFSPAWTPDGGELVYSAARAGSGYGGDMGAGLEAAELATGKTRKLCDCIALSPAVSPHGRTVVFWGIEPGARVAQRDLWAVPLSGLPPGVSPIRLTDDPAHDWDPQWAPDGSSVEFISDRGGSPNLWRLPIDEKSGRARGPAIPLTLPAAFVAHVRASADGGTRVYQSDSRFSVLLRVEFDPLAGRPREEPREALRLGEGIAGFSTSSFSPDGKWIVVQGGASNDDLMVLALDGSIARKLAPGPHRNRAPAWSPDGNAIVFGSDRGGKYEIWKIGADGSGLEKIITSQAALYEPAWSPDGTSLIASEVVETERRTRTIVHRIGDPPDRFERLPDLPGGTSFTGVLWSRDGNNIVGVDDGSMWTWSRRERSYRRIIPAVEGLRGAFPIGELPDGRLVVAVGTRVDVLDARSGESHRILALPDIAYGALAPGAGALWFNRLKEEADLWIARSSDQKK